MLYVGAVDISMLHCSALLLLFTYSPPWDNWQLAGIVPEYADSKSLLWICFAFFCRALED